MNGRDITFQIALPEDWQSIDLLGPEGEEVLDAPLAQSLVKASRGGEHAEMLMLRSLIVRAPGGRALSASLAVTIADGTTPVARGPVEPGSFAGRDVNAVTLPLGSGLCVSHVSAERPIPGAPPYDVLHVQYLLHTGADLLTLTFTTLVAPHEELWAPFFHAMAQTAEIASWS